jgi:hypothetical protein
MRITQVKRWIKGDRGLGGQDLLKFALKKNSEKTI